MALEKKIDDIKKEEMILRYWQSNYQKIVDIIQKSNTVLWNGPAGYFENENFANGTNAIAKKISENTIKNSLISILGGGDTIAAINKLKKN